MRLLTVIVAAAGCAASAFAIEIPAEQVSSRPIEGNSGIVQRENTIPVFSAIPGPYSAFSPAAGVLGFDDYDSIVEADSFLLGSFTFVGGLTAAGGLRVEFLDAANVVANQFTVNLPSGVNIWTIDLALNPKDSTFLVPSAGIVRLTTIAGGTAPARNGQWFLSTTAPSIGTQLTTIGSTAGGGSTGFSHRFELQQVPTPGALALAGAGGLLLSRRRRA